MQQHLVNLGQYSMDLQQLFLKVILPFMPKNLPHLLCILVKLINFLLQFSFYVLPEFKAFFSNSACKLFSLFFWTIFARVYVA